MIGLLDRWSLMYSTCGCVLSAWHGHHMLYHGRIGFVGMQSLLRIANNFWLASYSRLLFLAKEALCTLFSGCGSMWPSGDLAPV